jgi:hypothetical protein
LIFNETKYVLYSFIVKNEINKNFLQVDFTRRINTENINMKTCLQCGHLFDRDSSFENNFCPILHCGGEVVDIDDDILETIQLLNEKGYQTNYCCAGHTWGGEPYIVFSPNVHEKTFLSLPIDFTAVTASGGRIKIFKNIYADSDIDRLRLLNEASLDLLKWASTIPIPKSMTVQFEQLDDYDMLEFEELIQNELHLFNATKFEDDGHEFLSYDLVVQEDSIAALKKKIESFAADIDDVDLFIVAE